MSKTVILVCAHKQDQCLSEAPFMPIHVGKALSDKELGFQGDDTGDNMSNKNRNYCELTAHYWAWKNLKEVDFIGLNHYRRYFAFDRAGLSNLVTVKPNAFFDRPYTVPDFDKIFEKYDIVMPVVNIYRHNLYTNYQKEHIQGDMDILYDVVCELYPDYKNAFESVIFRRNRLSPCNMFVMPCKRFDHYSKWLFDLLFETERRIKISEDPVQARVFGFMSERLLNVYIHKNKLKVCRKSLFLVDERKHKGVCKYMYHAAVNNVLFAFNRLFCRCRRPAGR